MMGFKTKSIITEITERER